MVRLPTLSAAFLIALLACAEVSPQSPYPWLGDYDASQSIVERIDTPAGFERVSLPSGSFGYWLRRLPLKPGKPPVRLYNGDLKGNQDAHIAVVDIDVGSSDLQQCADAVIRLRAEYLFSQARYEEIRFNFTSGDTASFVRWMEGYRPIVRGNKVSWARSAGADSSYRTFREYLNSVFTYAGSYSLSHELISVDTIDDLAIGDVFILGSFPGHAVIMVDVAVNQTSGEKVFLLAQSYMPAQEIHVLRNPVDENLSPWYGTDFGNMLRTPEWIFRPSELMRWK
jgi:hypothetical protein